MEGDSMALDASTGGSERALQADGTAEALGGASVRPASGRGVAGPGLWRSSEVGLMCPTLCDGVMTGRSKTWLPSIRLPAGPWAPCFYSDDPFSGLE